MSNREKRLLLFVVVGLVLVLGYYFVYNPIIQKTEALKTEIGTYETELIQLRAQYNSRERYEEEIQLALAMMEDVEKSLPPDLQQERLFKLVFDIENRFPEIKMDSISFSEPVLLLNSDENADENTLSAFRRAITTSADFEYGDLKEFLGFIYNYKTKTVLNNMNLVLNEETGMVNMTIGLNMYGLTGGERTAETIYFDDVLYGNPLPFDSPNIDWDSLGYEQIDYPSDYQADLFLAINPFYSDGFTHSIGKVVDSNRSSYIEHKTNEELAGSIRIYNEGEKFYVNYDVDGVFKERQEIEVESALELIVYSSSRGEDDNAAINLTIYNQTERTLYIDVVSDDLTNPRFKYSIGQGEVVVK